MCAPEQENDSPPRTQPQDLCSDLSHSLPFASPCTHAPATGIPRAPETRAIKITHTAKDSALFSLRNVEHSHGEHWAVSYHARVLLRTAGITFRHTASNPGVGEGIQDALSAGNPLPHQASQPGWWALANTILQHQNPQERCQLFQ